MRISIFVLVFLTLPASAFAALYSCRGTVDGKSYLSHIVDTAIGAEYSWLFPDHPDAELSCGVEGESALHCRLFRRRDGTKRILFAEATIGEGDKNLRLSSPAFLDVGATITCAPWSE